MKLHWKWCLTGCLLVVGSAQAIKLEPGLWMIEMAGSEGMTGTLMSRKKIHCLADGEFDPTHATMMDNGKCTVSDLKDDGTHVTWNVQCPGGGPQIPDVTGTGNFDSEGKQMHGELVLKLNFGGREIKQQTKWIGHWVKASCE